MSPLLIQTEFIKDKYPIRFVLSMRVGVCGRSYLRCIFIQGVHNIQGGWRSDSEARRGLALGTHYAPSLQARVWGVP